ncbi:MAG: hypothetical protein JWM04_1475 [Verrucomicrobiales bacterium]|jgi:hypothetical protein|nr:hypothetical protein [Verrucomicrobiales bacterium]
MPAGPARLSITESHVRVAIHRLRKRFKDCVKLEITQTLDDPAKGEEELRSLQAALAS